ncbi:adenylate cyclase type 10 [Lepidochelys kempii]|uniref:adenylate cyclase type 10 n=1 Tax=Lepidochelys kempii TaxID=8472 RepID=UPI003C6FFD26
MDTSLDRGADQLTQTLNHYVGDIVEQVLIYGGDILNFAGDALLALWQVQRSQLSDIITLALKCSLRIQEEYGVRETEVGLELRVKIGLSAGHISKVVVGDNKHQYFLVIGRAVDEVRLAQNLAKASEVILSPNCWELCNRSMIEIERIKDQRAVKARYIKNISETEFDEFFWKCTEYLQNYPTGESNSILRETSTLSPNDKLEKSLRKFVMRNILKKIDDNQPLEYLSELRPVTIVFVNLQFDESANTLHLCQAIHNASMKISDTIHVFSGKINKVFMFDKGCTFLCVFGLPGDKQADESTHALDSAFKIFNFCSEKLMKIKLVSIGVTSGPVFCGVVGHRVRHEYTVIGQKVNLAARMMMYYPGLVSCDAVTYANSRLPHYFFEELPQTEMKGVVNPGVVYHYLGISEKTMIGKAYLTKERSEYYPLLGREKELEIYDTLLKGFVGSTEGRIIMYEGLMGYGKSQLLAEIAYLGQKAGHSVSLKQKRKTERLSSAVRLLCTSHGGNRDQETLLKSTADPQPFIHKENQVLKCLVVVLEVDQKGLKNAGSIISPSFGSFFCVSRCPCGKRVVAMELTKVNVQQNFFAIRTLMAMFLGIDACKSYDARQHILQGKLRGVVEQTYYCLLNNIFLVKFPTSAEVSKMDNETRTKEMELFLVKILQKAVEKDILIFVIDEAHFIDPASWEFLDNLLSSIPVFMVMSLAPFSCQARLPCVSAASIINNAKTIYVQLQELKPSVILQKACQDLGVVSIPRELETFLIQRSHGIPFYCEELLRNLHLNNMLIFHLWEEEEEVDDEWEILFTNAIKVIPSKTESLSSLDNDLYICTIRQNVKLQNIMLPPTLKGIALAELDNMSPSEQMVVKCAAIIGLTFTTELLLHILPEWTKRKMNQTLATLVDSHIFKCFNKRKDSQNAQSQDMPSIELLVCRGMVRSTGQESDIRSSVYNRIKQEQLVMQCSIMAFCTPLLQEAAYEVWLKSQKKALHLKCVSYLEGQAHKCRRCGEGDFISFHRHTVEMILVNTESQEDISEQHKEYPFSEAASLIINTTLKNLQAPSFEGMERKAVTAEASLATICSPESVQRTSEGAPLTRISVSRQPSPEIFQIPNADITTSTVSKKLELLLPQDTEKETLKALKKHKMLPEENLKYGSKVFIHQTTLQRNRFLGAPEVLPNPAHADTQESLVTGESCPFSAILSPARAEEIEKEFLERLDEIIQHSDRDQEKIRRLGSCKCEEIVESVFVPLARHCMAMGEYARALYYLLECAAAYLHLSNNYMAFCNLNTAENLIKSVDFRATVINQFEEATFYSLKGERKWQLRARPFWNVQLADNVTNGLCLTLPSSLQVCYNMGQMNLAKKFIRKALILLKRRFPFTLIGVFFKTLVEVSKHASHQKKQQFLYRRSKGEKKLAFLYQQGHCLSLLWQLFSLDTATNSKKFCRLAALMKVNSAEESEDESQIISSYTEFSLCCQMMGYQDEWMKYELMAIQRSSHLQVIGGGLLTTVKLAQSLAYMKLCLGNLPLSIQLGYRAHEMCVRLKKPKLDYLVLCMLFKALFLSIRYQDCVRVLSWMEELVVKEERIIGMAYFFSYCLELLLYAGFSFKSFKECLEFIQRNEKNCILMSQNSIMLGLYSSLAIWFARLHQWGNFKEPFEKARRLLRRTSASFFAISGFCRFLECEVLVLRKHIEEKPESVRDTRTKTLKDLDQVLSRCSTSPIYYPRVYHLKAYTFLVLGNEEQSQIYLSKAFKLCDIYGNLLEKSWLEISNEWWFTGKDPMEDLWLKAAPDFPKWEIGMTERDFPEIHKTKYLLRVPVLDINNPFPEPEIPNV